MVKKITLFSYLYSIFNKQEYLQMNNKIYSKFMINRFLYSVNNADINDIVDDLNQLKYQNITNEHHYEILYTAVPKGWYKIPKKMFFTENTKWNKLKIMLSKFGNVDSLKISDITFIMSLMKKNEIKRLYDRVELLEK